MNKKRKPVPTFRNEAEERTFRESHDSSDYVDWDRAAPVRFANLKPSSKATSWRQLMDMLEQIKIAANKRDVPYQSLIKVWLAEKIDAAWGIGRNPEFIPPRLATSVPGIERLEVKIIKLLRYSGPSRRAGQVQNQKINKVSLEFPKTKR